VAPVEAMIDDRTVREAVDRLLRAAPGSTVILFGSYARGQASGESDLDFLVVEPEVRDAPAEMVRLRQVLADLPVAVDVLVVSRERFDYWKDTPNTVMARALREGRVYEPVA
jgi:predicted nucleotidyltransferase